MTKQSHWSIATNPFLSAVKGSYMNTKKMSNFYLGKLKANTADTDINTLYTKFLPFDTMMNDSYSSFISQGGIQSGSSETFSVKLIELTASGNQWDSAAQLIYAKGTPKYLTLFPNGHTGLQKGTQIDKLTAIVAHSKALGIVATPDATNAGALNSIKAKVDSFYTDLKKTYDDKNDGKNISSIQSDACFDATIAVCEQMYIGLGTLMIKFYKTPDVIAGYFDEATIRSHKQTDFTHTLKHAQTYTIAERTLATTNQIRINNTGVVPLRFFAANTKDGAIGATFLEVAAGINHEYAASQLGDIANNHFIIVSNPDAIQAGSFVLNLL